MSYWPQWSYPAGMSGGEPDNGFVPQVPEYTGEYLVILREEPKKAMATLKNVAGISSVASADDFAYSAMTLDSAPDKEARYLPIFKTAIVEGDPDRATSLSRKADPKGSIPMVVPVTRKYLISGNSQFQPPIGVMPQFPPIATPIGLGGPFEYLRGYQDAVNHLAAGMCGMQSPIAFAAPFVGPTPIAAQPMTNGNMTWGLQATRVGEAGFSGKGVKVAILDTGFDATHPDFFGRRVIRTTFTSMSEDDFDVHGHGTHCIGTACGPLRPASGEPRYGIAYDAEIFSGQVFHFIPGFPKPTTDDGIILRALEWAVASGCRVVSMSLGGNAPDTGFFDHVGRMALDNNCLLIAAAGNHRQSGQRVSSPANSKHIMAVAAVDRSLRVAPFSNPSRDGDAGKVNIAGPGVDVRSARPGGSYQNMDGTSQATPHVAGVAALMSEAFGDIGGDKLWNLLVNEAKVLPGASAADVGMGLVQWAGPGSIVV